SLDKASIITLLAGVSICEAVKEILGLGLQIKWPNDILMHNKKLGGILTEIKAEVDEVNFIIIGVGLNINNDSKTLISGSTSLKECKSEQVSRLAILQEVFYRLEVNYHILEKNGPKAIIEKWRQFAITLGRRVKVYSHKEHLEGEAFDIDSDGGLLIRNDSGITHKVLSGDILYCR
ncbi:MAG: biotin--[acetyl-CoA-carboxylase] ligase, partial [Nitrospirota bacterium]